VDCLCLSLPQQVSRARRWRATYRSRCSCAPTRGDRVKQRRRCLQWLAAAPAVSAPALWAHPVERVVRIGALRTSAQPASATEPQLAYLRNALRELCYLAGRNLVLKLALNLSTARVIGVALPQALLLRANQVIE
jgi:hypothetical protein